MPPKAFLSFGEGKVLGNVLALGPGLSIALPQRTKMCLSYTSFFLERPLPGLSTKCCFWGSKWPVHYSCSKMCFFTQTLQTNGRFQLKCVFVIETLSTNGNFQDCLQNVASGAPNGQLSTFELNMSFFYKLYQRTATSRTSGAPHGQFSTFELKCGFFLHTLSTNGNFQDCLQNMVFWLLSSR